VFGISLAIRPWRMHFPASSLPRLKALQRHRHAGLVFTIAFGGISCTDFRSASFILSATPALRSLRWRTTGVGRGTGSSDDLRAL
jgi:hypothetical protein